MTDYALTRDHYEIELIDDELVTVGHLNDCVRPVFALGCYGSGETSSLALHPDAEFASLIPTADLWFVRVYRNGVYWRAYMFSGDDWGWSGEGASDQYIEITLQPLDAISSWRVCQPETGSGTFQTPELPVDDGFKWIVDKTLGPNAYTSPGAKARVVSGLAIDADDSVGASQVISVCNKLNLMDFLQKYGPTYDVDWQFTLDKTTGNANELAFHTYPAGRGADKTVGNGARAPVVLNDADGNLGKMRRYRRTGAAKNAVMAKALTTERTDETSVSALRRREMLAHTDETDALDAMLESKAVQEGYEIDFVPTAQCRFGVEFVVGDTVTVGHNGMGLGPDDMMIKEATVRFDDQGAEQVRLVLGQFEKTLIDNVKDAGGGAGGGGGGGGATYIDPIMGLKDDDDTFVPFSMDPDYQYVKITSDDGSVAVVGDVGTNSLDLSVGDVPVHDIITKHEYTGGATLDVIGLSAADTLAVLTPSSSPGATAKLLCSDASGYLALTRFVLSTNQYITRSGTAFQVYSDGIIAFSPNSTRQFRMLTTGTFEVETGDLQITTAGKGIILSDNTAGKVLRGDGTRYVPARLAITDLSAQHNHTISASGAHTHITGTAGAHTHSTNAVANHTHTYKVGDADTGPAGGHSHTAISNGDHDHGVTTPGGDHNHGGTTGNT